MKNKDQRTQKYKKQKINTNKHRNRKKPYNRHKKLEI